VEVQLSLHRREVLRARLDGVDPDPVAFLEAGYLMTELFERYHVSAKGPVPEDLCLHPRSVPEPLGFQHGATRCARFGLAFLPVDER
jgi:hypothetical protein